MKKIVSLFLALVLVLSLCPVTTFAADDAADDSDWSNGETLSAGPYDLSGATITITGTLTVDGTVTVKNGTIKRGSGFTGAMFTVGSGDSLTLEGVTVDGGAVWGGTEDTVLKRGTTNSGISSSAPLIDAGGETTDGGFVVLTNCELCNNVCSEGGEGGAITVGRQGSLTATNTKVYNNAKTQGQAGAIKAYIGATVNLTGCELYGNKAVTHGGAIQIWGGNYPGNIVYMKMTDCTVCNNKAGGVGGGIAVSDYSKFVMSGGTIKDNATTDADKRGGGVGFSDKNTSMSISGDAVISRNRAKDDVNNLYVGTNDCNKLAVGEMGDNADVGVTMKSSSGGVFTNGGASYVAQFESDNVEYKVAADGGNLKLVAAGTTTYTVTFDANGHGTAPSAQSSIAAGGKVSEPANPTENGWTFGGWYKEAACTDAYDFNSAVNSSFTLYAKWTENTPVTYTVTYADGGGTGTDPTQNPTAAGGTFTLAQNPYTKSGYTFAGWNDGANTYAAGATYTMPANNVILTAQWTENSTGGPGTQQPSYNYPIYIPPVEEEPEVTAPKTFDGGIASAVVVTILSATGGAWLAKKKD